MYISERDESVVWKSVSGGGWISESLISLFISFFMFLNTISHTKRDVFQI